ncbi:MAG TPA: DNA N-6-adenine-methyltransferase [Solirubrobacterales bacterium]|jgi:hypothetical protein|nr:DNA N-6-adenine-methyltransferase [Solirubrobacterales bacterium]
MSEWEAVGQSDEWYTPPEVFEALGCRFDLDVAAPAEAEKTFVPADLFCYIDGLNADWHGFVWMNPPFGGRNEIGPWLAKFFDHGNGIALTPDRTSAPWFQDAWSRAELVLFTRKLAFVRPDGSRGESPANGTALWAVGEKGQAALVRAASKGFGRLAIVPTQLELVA